MLAFSVVLLGLSSPLPRTIEPTTHQLHAAIECANRGRSNSGPDLSKRARRSHARTLFRRHPSKANAVARPPKGTAVERPQSDRPPRLEGRNTSTRGNMTATWSTSSFASSLPQLSELNMTATRQRLLREANEFISTAAGTVMMRPLELDVVAAGVVASALGSVWVFYTLASIKLGTPIEHKYEFGPPQAHEAPACFPDAALDDIPLRGTANL